MKRKKTEKVLAIVLSMLMVFSMMPASVFAAADNTGSSVRVVKTAEELIADIPEGTTVELSADIELSADQQIGIVAGTLDGKGHTVTLNGKPLADEVTGTIQNMGLVGDKEITMESAGISFLETAGSFAVRLNKGSILNCFSTVPVKSGLDDLGGLAGTSIGGTIRNSFYGGTISGLMYGGLIGKSADMENPSVITECYYTSGENPVSMGVAYNKDEGRFGIKSAEDMKKAGFADLLNENITNTGFVWEAAEGDFPKLAEATSGPDTEPGTLNKTKLEARIKEASELNKSDYTESTWQDFEKELANAKAALEATEQKTIDSALKALNKAIDGLKKALPTKAVKLPEDGSVIEISTVSDLEKIGKGTGKYYRLKNDLTIKTSDWYFTFDAFEGVFDGNGKTITLEGSSKLFSKIAPSGVVQNTNFAGTDLTGAPVTDTLYGALINCSSSVSGKDATGLVKRISGGVISNCVAYGKAGSGSLVYAYGGTNWETDPESEYIGKIYNSYWITGAKDPDINRDDLLGGSSAMNEKEMQNKAVVESLNAEKGDFGIAWGQNGTTGFPYFGPDQSFTPEDPHKLSPVKKGYTLKFNKKGDDSYDITKSQELEVSPDELLDGNILGNFSLEGLPEGSTVEWDLVTSEPEDAMAINRKNGALHVYGEGEAVFKATERNKAGAYEEVASVRVISKAKKITDIRLYINGVDVTGRECEVAGSAETQIVVKGKFEGTDIYKTVNPSRFIYSTKDGDYIQADGMVHKTETSSVFSFKKPGKTTFDVTHVDDKSLKATVDVTSTYVPVEEVKQNIGDVITIHGLNLLSENGRAYLEQKDGLTILPENASNKGDWEITSSNPEVANYIKYLVYGYVPYKMGKTTFTATVTDVDPNGKVNKVSSEKEVEFKYYNPLVSIGTPENVTMKAGEEKPVEGLVFTGEKTENHVSDASMKWTYSEDGIVKVYRKGNGYKVEKEPGFTDSIFVDNDNYLVKAIKPGKVTVTGTPVDTTNGVKPVKFTVEVAQGTVKPVDLQPLIDKGINGGLNYLLQSDLNNLGYNDEWLVFTLERIGKPLTEAQRATYLDNLAKEVKTWKANQKPTDIERVILAVNAVGADPADIGGKDLTKMVYNHKGLKEGSNELAFALISLDSNATDIPASALWSRDKMIEELVKFQNKDGGFALFPKGDSGVDTTAMAIQALAPYMDRADVKAVVDKGLEYLALQLDPGYGYSTSEAVSQTIIALSSIGLDSSGYNNPDFGNPAENLITSLMSYYNESAEGFKHEILLDTNKMATLQAVEALDAYNRFLKGNTRYYDLTDMHRVGTVEHREFIKGEKGTVKIDAALTDKLMNEVKEKDAEIIKILVNEGKQELKSLDVEISRVFLERMAASAGPVTLIIHGAETELHLDKDAITELSSEAGETITLHMERISDKETNVTFNDKKADSFTKGVVKVVLPVAAGNNYPVVTFNGNVLDGRFAGEKVTVVVNSLGKYIVNEDLVQKEADRVIDLIDAIGRNVSLGSGEKIAAARNAYDALDAEAKARVTNLNKLEKAEKAFAVIRTEADRPVNKAETDKVNGNTVVKSETESAVVKPSTIKNATSEIEFVVKGNMTVTYDKKAIEEISKYINDKDINVVVELHPADTNSKFLTKAQKNVLKENSGAKLYEITMTVTKMDGRKVEIHNFNGGKATITIPYANPLGKTLEVYRLNDNGTLKLMNSSYKEGMLTWNTDGHSFYMVKEIGEGTKVTTGEETKATSPKTGDTENMIPWMVLLLGAAAATAVLRRKED